MTEHSLETAERVASRGGAAVGAHLRSRRSLPEGRSVARHVRTSGRRASADAPTSNGRLRCKSGCAAAGRRAVAGVCGEGHPPPLRGPAKIAHRLVSRIGRPYARQFAGPMQPRQRNRISPVRFDPLARPFRDQSRGDHHAFVAERLDLPIKPVSRRPGFKKNPAVVSARQSLDRSLDRQRAVLDVAEKPDFSVRPPSAIAIACFDLATSKATKASLYLPLVRPRMRLGSVRPSNPRSQLHKERATGSTREHERDPMFA